MKQRALFFVIFLLHFVAYEVVDAKQSTARTDGTRPVFQVVNKLGLDSTVEVGDVSFETGDTDDDAVLEQYIVGGHSAKIVLKVSAGVYICIPFETFQEAWENDGVHVVRLSDGQELKGRMVSILHDSRSRPVDLRAATRVILKSLPESAKSPKQAEQKPLARWNLLLKPQDFKYTLVNPAFAYRYYSTDGYVRGGSMRVGYSESFYFMLENDSVLVDPAGFQTISFNQATPQDQEKTKKLPVEGTPGAKTIVKTVAKNGTETLGRVGFKPSEAAKPRTYAEWYLVLDSSGGELRLILKSPACSLRKAD